MGRPRVETEGVGGGSGVNRWVDLEWRQREWEAGVQ